MKRATTRAVTFLGMGSVLLTVLPSSCQMQLSDALVNAAQASLIGLAATVLDPCNVPGLDNTATCVGA